jgi:hypothetical protein
VPNARSKQLRWKLLPTPFATLFSREKRDSIPGMWPWVLFLILPLFFSAQQLLPSILMPARGSSVACRFQFETGWVHAFIAAASNYRITLAGFGSGAVGFSRHQLVRGEPA